MTKSYSPIPKENSGESDGSTLQIGLTTIMTKTTLSTVITEYYNSDKPSEEYSSASIPDDMGNNDKDELTVTKSLKGHETESVGNQDSLMTEKGEESQKPTLEVKNEDTTVYKQNAVHEGGSNMD